MNTGAFISERLTTKGDLKERANGVREHLSIFRKQNYSENRLREQVEENLHARSAQE